MRSMRFQCEKVIKETEKGYYMQTQIIGIKEKINIE